MNFESVREALSYALLLSDEKTKLRNSDGSDATIEDYKELYREALYSACDYLGMEDLYLD
ncbi:hypothetical protein [Ligilactobacillus salivarius]|jgi:hypothetical protein|uniref:hypothetical protein n=1 Tax=Ligilactobacillus salivarius TaxID=1624 RepID=UPI00136B3C55|nr:hypothetical protein [Ligilactobacillus salivarius]MYV14817.1 hypothetical protein [Ligilactobacillus salivarius]MYZ84049.1 hypothetical protein [Ligilactobacillus salivarius]DAT81137.1 MAG TPA: hypothetical protein [Caudoviricetes sp.]